MTKATDMAPRGDAVSVRRHRPVCVARAHADCHQLPQARADFELVFFEPAPVSAMHAACSNSWSNRDQKVSRAIWVLLLQPRQLVEEHDIVIAQ